MSEASDGAGFGDARDWNEAIALARGAFAAQPFSALIGAELVAFEPGTAELRVPYRPELLQQFGFMHGE
ncbi:PaaI family thioesterase [Leifsonia poae]|uniref:PaaI family thioesterase n=1 Tax=Leifsonia poae TaxID=110933 RepID=UPI003D679F32